MVSIPCFSHYFGLATASHTHTDTFQQTSDDVACKANRKISKISKNCTDFKLYHTIHQNDLGLGLNKCMEFNEDYKSKNHSDKTSNLGGGCSRFFASMLAGDGAINRTERIMTSCRLSEFCDSKLWIFKLI